jgi:hypothetical protein
VLVQQALLLNGIQYFQRHCAMLLETYQKQQPLATEFNYEYIRNSTLTTTMEMDQRVVFWLMLPAIGNCGMPEGEGKAHHWGHPEGCEVWKFLGGAARGDPWSEFDAEKNAGDFGLHDNGLRLA